MVRASKHRIKPPVMRNAPTLNQLLELAEQYAAATALGERQTVLAECQRMHDKNQIMTVTEAANKLGCHRHTIAEWEHKGYLRSVRVGRHRYLSAWDVSGCSSRTGAFTTYEVAAQTGLSVQQVQRQAREGKLVIVSSPTWGFRFEAGEQIALAKSVQPQASLEIPTREVAQRLRVTLAAVEKWIKRGYLSHRIINGRSYCPADEVIDLETAFNQLPPNFFWLQRSLEAIHQLAQTFTRQQTSHHLGLEISSIRKWSRDQLLPFYSRTPPAAKACYVADYPAIYIRGLLRYAGGRPTKDQAASYRDQCTAASQLV